MDDVKNEKDLVCGLLGRKLGHTFSPLIHKAAGEYSYGIFEREPEEVADFFKNGNYDAINVTVPYKIDALNACQVLSEEARAIGAVNTVVRKEGKLYGYNTDYFGFVYMLEKAGVSPFGKKCLVPGSGGASKTVVAALSRLGAESVSVVSRSGDVNYDNVYEKCKDVEIIVNTTPVGMFPDVNKKPLDISKFASCEFVGDVIYNPSVTRILYEAQRLGIKTANGLDMLVAQGVKASAFFTGRDEMKSELIPEICAEVKKKTVNIVLVGMPGCGKSSVGRLLAQKLGREFVDIDKEIEKRQNCTVPEIFARGGEEEFRRIETEVTEDVCKRSGLVIATGGGVVTRPENQFSLKCNGFTVYLKRDIESLSTDGRPLSAAKGREKLFSERKHLYEGWSDITADNNGEIEACVSSITSSFDKFLTQK